MVLDRDACKTFLENLNLSILSAQDRDLLEEPLTLKEFHNAAESLREVQSPGPGGIHPELYLAVWDIVGPLILSSINYAIKYGVLHRNENIALIVLLHRKNKDPLNCSSYRPMSLINSDVKILAKPWFPRLSPSCLPRSILTKLGFWKGGCPQTICDACCHHTYPDTCAVFFSRCT